MQTFESKLAEALEAALTKVSGPSGGRFALDIAGSIEIPPDPAFGDYAFPCFPLAKHLRRPPAEIAAALKEEIQLPEGIGRTEVHSGYLNFFVDGPVYAAQVLDAVLSEREEYGRSSKGAGKTIVIDYSSPNIAKPFSVAHLRTTVIGHSLARIFEALGHRVVRVNYWGDWGTQFGRLIAAYRRSGREIEEGPQAIRAMFDLYVQFHQEMEENPELEAEGREWFRRLEEGDRDALALWRRFRADSLAYFHQVYDRIGIHFDDETGESAAQERVEEAIGRLEEAGLLSESQGALVVDLGEEMPPCLIRKQDGSTLYATRDIAAALQRYEKYNFDHMLYVVSAQQSLHFRQVFSVLSRLGLEWADRLEHISFGAMHFGNQVMSTRRGNVVFLEDLLDEAKERVLQIMADRRERVENAEAVADQVGMAAVIFSDLSHARNRDIHFDWNEALNFDGDTGPYLQYTHARARSVLRKASALPDRTPRADWEPAEMNLIKWIARLTAMAERAAEAREPSVIAHHLLEGAQLFNAFYHAHRILDGSEKESARLALTDAFSQALRNGLYWLGISAPEEM